jgi:prepilin-type N-terminal cleavage/methylation domain-containing protein
VTGATRVKGCEAGFTLVEILVGLLISSLIMVGLGLATKTINMGVEQTTASIRRDTAISAGLYIAGGDIARVERVFDDPAKPAQFLFSGKPGEVIFILTERPENNHAGAYWIRFQVRGAPGGEELVRERAPYNPLNTDPRTLRWADAVVLMRGDIAIEFSYRAPRTGLREWQGTWEAHTVLPGEIKIEIVDQGTGRLRVPTFVQTLRIGAESMCAAGLPGCTSKSNGFINAGG